MLDGIEQNKDNDIPVSKPICSATTPVFKMEARFNHVFIGTIFKVRPRTFGCVAMGSALLFILRYILVYSAGCGGNRVQVVLSGFSMRLFCFVQAKTFM